MLGIKPVTFRVISPTSRSQWWEKHSDILQNRKCPAFKILLHYRLTKLMHQSVKKHFSVAAGWDGACFNNFMCSPVLPKQGQTSSEGSQDKSEGLWHVYPEEYWVMQHISLLFGFYHNLCFFVFLVFFFFLHEIAVNMSFLNLKQLFKWNHVREL